MHMDTNVDGLISTMEEQLAGAEEKKLRFFRLDELKRNIRRIGHYAPACEVCHLFYPEAEATATHIGEAVNVPGVERRELDRLIFRLSNHMMKDHGYFPKYHFRYRFTIIGIFAGVLAGILLYALFPSTGWILPAAGLIAGLVTGQVMGRMRDRKIKAQNKVM